MTTIRLFVSSLVFGTLPSIPAETPAPSAEVPERALAEERVDEWHGFTRRGFLCDGLIHVVGDADTVVPAAENALLTEQRYKALGGRVQVIHKPGVDHHPHGLDDPAPVVNFIIEAATKASVPHAGPLAARLVGELRSEGAPARLEAGSTFPLGGRTATLTKLDTLPFVEDEYSRRFKFDSYDNPKLKELRERHGLETVIAPGKDEFDKQVLLMDWVHRQFKKFGRPTADSKGALEILRSVSEGHTFFCAHYAQVLVSAAASLGWVDRELALRRHQGVNKNGGSTEHTTTEIWSNQHRKWVMLDPTSNMYLEKAGIPLNAFEIRQEWFYRGGKDLVFVIGKERRRYRKPDLPVFLGRFDGFGDLTIDPDELDKYGFTGYIPNTDLMDAGLDYAKMFIIKDKLCEGTRWHDRTVPADPAVDPYFPIGQAALSLAREADTIIVTLKTMTPNLKEFQLRIDGAEWKPCGERFVWRVRPGPNRLEARTGNRFGVQGAVSTAEISVSR